MKLLSAALLAATCLVGTAKAEDLNFFFDDSYVGITLAFDLPSTPTPTSFTDDSTSFLVETTFYNVCCGTAINPTLVTFTNPSDYGGFSFYFGLSLYGPQLFTGSPSAPVFAPGSVELEDTSGEPWFLTISAITSPAPEPSTWAFMIAGLGVIGSTLRSVRRRTTAAIA